MRKHATFALLLLLSSVFGFVMGANKSRIFYAGPETKADTVFRLTDYGNIYGTTPDNNIVGRLGSYSMQSSVNECGASEIVIPLEFNDGINGMTPKLSLCYNSRSGNGIMGLGWSLGGMSKISRVPFSYIYNDSCASVHFSDSDMLALDGNTLVKGLKDGAICYYPEIYDFSIVYPITNGYKVLKSNGVVNTYTSKYMLQGIGEPIEWHLTRSEDPFGNYIEYFYTNDAANGVSFHYRNENETFYHCVNASDAIKYHDGRFNYDIYNVGIWESIKKIGGYKPLDIKRVALIHILKLMHRP